MCYNLSDYNPFEPLIILDDGDGEYVDNKPMEDYSWEEWLEGGNDDEISYCSAGLAHMELVMRIRIIRVLGLISDQYCYTSDPINGVAEVQKSAFDAYCEALECVNNFENEVDRQYRDAGYDR